MLGRTCCRVIACRRRLEAFLQITLRNGVQDVHFLGLGIGRHVARMADAAVVAQETVATECQSSLHLKDLDGLVEAGGKEAA